MLLLTELAARLFNPAGLTPHGFCLLWQPWLIWINVIANAIVGLSYFCIPLVLVVFARRRPDLAFRPIAWLFAAFILLCGTTHALDVLTLWLPAYGLQAMFLAATAAVSLTTAIACWILLPKALRLPSSGQLHEAKAALEDSESRYRAAIFATSAQYDPERERMLDMLGLAATMVHDPDGSIRFWSVGCERLYGWTAEEAIGRSAHELLATVFPTPVAEIDDELRTQGEWNGTVRQFTKAGAEVCVNARAVLRRDDSGRPLVMTSLSDTTELSRAEAALREREEQLHSVVATAADGIILAHVDGRIVSINPAGLRMFGYERETDLIGRNLRVLMPANEATPMIRGGAPNRWEAR
jgi:PAS domain S-box-containing protein